MMTPHVLPLKMIESSSFELRLSYLNKPEIPLCQDYVVFVRNGVYVYVIFFVFIVLCSCKYAFIFVAFPV